MLIASFARSNICCSSSSTSCLLADMSPHGPHGVKIHYNQLRQCCGGPTDLKISVKHSVLFWFKEHQAPLDTATPDSHLAVSGCTGLH